jgi:beta-lactamase family protein
VRRTLVTLTLAIALLAPAAVPAVAASAPWEPDLNAARNYASHRTGEIGFAVRTEHHFWGYRATPTFPSASVIKAMCLVAYLNHPDVRNRDLTANDYDLLGPMIRRSSDAATNKVVSYIGYSRLRALAKRVGMKHFSTRPIWGRSRINASDQSLFFLHIDDYTPPRHREAALQLLSSITESQRWGLWKVIPPGWDLFSKGGWGLGTGWVDHQAALLKRGDQRVSIAILQHNTGTHAYGKETLRALGKILFRGLENAETVD